MNKESRELSERTRKSFSKTFSGTFALRESVNNRRHSRLVNVPDRSLSAARKYPRIQLENKFILIKTIDFYLTLSH